MERLNRNAFAWVVPRLKAFCFALMRNDVHGTRQAASTRHFPVAGISPSHFRNVVVPALLDRGSAYADTLPACVRQLPDYAVAGGATGDADDTDRKAEGLRTESRSHCYV